MVEIPCLLDACFTLKEADPLKHGQPIFEEAASTDLDSKIRRRSDLAAYKHQPPKHKGSLIMRVAALIRSNIFVSFLSTRQLDAQDKTCPCL